MGYSSHGDSVMKVFSILVAILSLIAASILGGCAQNTSLSQAAIAEIESKTVPVGDIDVGYKMFGEGEPIILITGYGATMDLWCPEMLAGLAAHYKVIIFDNRGMGKTTASDKEFTIELFAEDTAGLMNTLNINHAHVAGGSMGSYIAQELALKYPEMVDKLILYAADCGGQEAIYPDPEVMAVLTGVSDTNGNREEQLFKTLFPQKWLEDHPNPSTYFPIPTETSPAENIKCQYEAWEKWSGTYSRLPKITQPTLIITGTDDVLAPPENAFVIAKRIPGSWVIQLEGGGHGVMYQYPERFSQILLTFLKD